MNRYMIVIPAKNRSFVLECDEGDGAKPETLQKLVSGYVETVPAALDATWAREEADRLVLLVDEDGRLKWQGREPEGHAACPGGRHGERQAAHRGRCRADVPAGRQAAGVYKARGRHHLQRVAVRRGGPCGRRRYGTRGSCPRI